MHETTSSSSAAFSLLQGDCSSNIPRFAVVQYLALIADRQPYLPKRRANVKMDFAPYQDQSPETQRTLSPPPRPSLDGPAGRRSFSPPNGRRSSSFSPAPALQSPVNPPPTQNPWAASASAFGNSVFGNHGDVEAGNREDRLNEFETSLPIRLDYEACLAYLLLPPAGGVLLLIAERKSDYVRYVIPSINKYCWMPWGN